MTENYYDIMGVATQASPTELKERFRFLANAYHPDKFSSPTHKEHAEAEFKKINQAYQVLSDPTKRASYNRQLGLTRSDPTAKATPKPKPSPAAGIDFSVYAYGFMRTVFMFLFFYSASSMFFRLGVPGLVLVLLVTFLIYTKYFQK